MCCVELGVHLDFLPVIGGGAAELEAMTVTRCEVRKRLTPRSDLQDYWWQYGDEAADEDLVAVVESVGLTFFQQLETFPDYWQHIALEDLRNETFSNYLPGMTRVRAVLLLARMHSFLGDVEGSRSLAAYGLEIVPAIASGPKKAFRELLAPHAT
jgi:hypothetical protein